MDDEEYSNGPVAAKSFERREKVDDSLVAVGKPSDTEAITVDKPQASIQAKPSTVSEMKKINDQAKSDVPVTTEKSSIFSFPTASPSSTTANVIEPESTTRPEKIASSEVPKAAAAPIFGFGEKLPSQKDSVFSSPTFTFGNKVTTSTNEQNAVPAVTSEGNVAPTLQASAPTTFKFGDKATFPIPASTATENGNSDAGSPFKFASSLVNEKGAKAGSASVFKSESSSSRLVCLLLLSPSTWIIFISFYLYVCRFTSLLLAYVKCMINWILNVQHSNFQFGSEDAPLVLIILRKFGSVFFSLYISDSSHFSS